MPGAGHMLTFFHNPQIALVGVKRKQMKTGQSTYKGIDMAKGNLTKKQRKQAIEAMHLVVDQETMRQMELSLETSKLILGDYHYEMRKDDLRRPVLAQAIEEIDAVLKRYREGR